MRTKMLCRLPKHGFHATITTVVLIWLCGNPTCTGLYADLTPDGNSARQKRSNSDVTRQTVRSATPIPENVTSQEDLVDLSTVLANRTFEITGSSLDVQDLFIVTSELQLRLSASVSQSDRNEFDFDTHHLVEVYINATSNFDDNDVLLLTVELQLSDVNDEKPEYITQPKPYLAAMAETAQAGTVIFTLSLTDPDTDADIDVRIASVSPPGGANRFQLNVAKIGNVWEASIVTVGNNNFGHLTQYMVQVTAVDTNAVDGDQMVTESVDILVGQRPPQFYSSKYTGSIDESVEESDRNGVLTESGSPLEIQTISFQNRTISYQIIEADGTVSERFVIDPRGQIFNQKVIDYETTKIVNLRIEATEAVTYLASSAEISIHVQDRNDHSPRFIQPLFYKNVSEDTTIGSGILNVTAKDLDSGLNGELIFSISDNDYFEVSDSRQVETDTYTAAITVKRTLDYDHVQDPSYSMNLLVQDKGSPARSSSAQVIIFVTNANDNPPDIDNSSRIISLVESAVSGYAVTVLQASDIDGDEVSFSFPGNSDEYEIFKIERGSNILRTTSTIPAGRNSYDLPIDAVDDGSCCTPPKSLSSRAVFTINIEGVNNHKPDFVNCSDYDATASVKEKSRNGTKVIQVKAEDPDRGENGRVIYAIINSDEDFPFAIDENTGVITVTREDITRDNGEFLQVIMTGKNPVKGQDLQGWCTFRVRIEDINDHSPVFSKKSYVQDIPASSTPPFIVRQMVATDEDVGVNANLTYSLHPNDVFDIDPYSGVVTLKADSVSRTTPLQDCGVTDATYCMVVQVSDNGVPFHLTDDTELAIYVRTDQTNPSWTSGPGDLAEIDVNESVKYDSVIAQFSCQSNIQDNPRVDFIVFDSENSIEEASKIFRPSHNGTRMNLLVSAPLDYEKRQKYYITIVCQSFESSDSQAFRSITINVLDENDNFPHFVGLLPGSARYEGSVAEDAEPGATVITVTANDDDINPDFNKVRFTIDGEENNELFEIKPDAETKNRAFIVTKPALELDRETTDNYVIRISATDSQDDTKKATRLVHVTVTDVNDNPPRFEEALYQHNVSETSPINSLVFSVTANDNDTVDMIQGLNYYFEEGTVYNPFSIRPVSGDIIVSGKLDYERNPKVYRLILVATDQYQWHTATTTVEISITDENDNRPEFIPPSYRVTGVVSEEDLNNTPSSPLPLTRVTATDKDENFQISYSLVSPAVNFTIDSGSGVIYLIGSLDRDGITPDFRLIVRAQDAVVNPLTSYADVIVVPTDINDNRPIFYQPLSGSVDEHSQPLVKVMTVTARDTDEGLNGLVKYELDPQSSLPNPQYFTINEDGEILTNENGPLLDRERIDQILLPIIAFDQGTPRQSTSATVTISLVDINDQSPYFEEHEYRIFTPENSAGQIGLIQAYDKDSNERNRNFQFTLEDEPPQFRVIRQNDAASINIKDDSHIDYETDVREFTFLLKVTDGIESHTNQTRIQVTITDVNDNAPIFGADEVSVTFVDGTKPQTFVTQFNASDKDGGLNAEIIFSITRESDPRYEFFIDPISGVVTTRKELDRETEEIIEVTIVATDQGKPPMSSTAKLIITLTDINDNAPQFKEDYLPKVMENEPNNDRQVVEIFATDPDNPPFGPPFGFKLPNGCDIPACSFFQLEMNENGDNNRGTAFIKTSTTFNREETKEYYLPIIMWDMRDQNDDRSLTATNTLTIVIGDENDNRHKPGHQDIIVQDIKGLIKPFEIGRVYAEDPDDWDLPDKTFTFLSPEIMKNYFTVAEDTGVIEIKEGVPSNIDTGRPPYEFKVSVYDKKWGNTETCTVSVTVRTLDDQAVWKSGSMRLTGISSEDFIHKFPSSTSPPSMESKYDRLREMLASDLGYSEVENVQIVSVMDNGDFLDVRFSAHGSPYLNPAQIESVVMLHQNKYETELGVNIQQLPINLCMEEVYDEGCHTELNVTSTANTVNANGTSFVGVQTFTAPVSGCIDCVFPEPVNCRGDYCYNGGTCVEDGWNKIVCKCLTDFDGPRCQQRRHSFSGTSVAFYEALSICNTGRTSFDLITTENNGVILFGTSQMKPETNAPKDYFIMELNNGYPHLRLNLGTKELALSLDDNYSTRAVKLNDGKWHHIDIDKDDKNVVVTVDKCRSGIVENNTLDDTSCSISGTVPGPDILLNTQGFLQIGGFYPNNYSTSLSVQAQRFSGCIRNLIHNTKLYDLHFKSIPIWDSGQAHCPDEDLLCKPSGTAVCGKMADCESEWMPQARVVSCRCHPGWYGDKCQQETPIKEFKSQSFFKWELKPELISQAAREHSIEMFFRTYQSTGTLFAMSSMSLNTILIQLVDGKVTLFYDVGEGQQKLTLDNAFATLGHWHFLRVDKFGSEFTLSLDNAEGRNHIYRLRSQNANVNFNALPVISAGARVAPETLSVKELTYDLMNTCISDIRFNGHYLHLEKQENMPDGSVSLIESQNIENNCTFKDCGNHTCLPTSVCYPHVEIEQCSCAGGSNESNLGICIPTCVLYPCYNGGKCTSVKDVATCSCDGPWEGEHCNLIIPEDGNDSAFLAGEIAGIVIGVLILLVLIVVIILFLLWYFCKRNGKEKSIDDLLDDDAFSKENVMYHEEECAGEEDNEGFDLTLLQMPDSETNLRPHEAPTLERDVKRRAPDLADKSSAPIGHFIANNMEKIEQENDGDSDSLKAFNYEGTNSDADSLSSLSASSLGSDTPDYDYLNDWGPKFSRLANIYGAGQNED